MRSCRIGTAGSCRLLQPVAVPAGFIHAGLSRMEFARAGLVADGRLVLRWFADRRSDVLPLGGVDLSTPTRQPSRSRRLCPTTLLPAMTPCFIRSRTGEPRHASATKLLRNWPPLAQRRPRDGGSLEASYLMKFCRLIPLPYLDISGMAFIQTPVPGLWFRTRHAVPDHTMAFSAHFTVGRSSAARREGFPRHYLALKDLRRFILSSVEVRDWLARGESSHADWCRLARLWRCELVYSRCTSGQFVALSTGCTSYVHALDRFLRPATRHEPSGRLAHSALGGVARTGLRWSWSRCLDCSMFVPKIMTGPVAGV